MRPRLVFPLLWSLVACGGGAAPAEDVTTGAADAATSADSPAATTNQGPTEPAHPSDAAPSSETPQLKPADAGSPPLGFDAAGSTAALDSAPVGDAAARGSDSGAATPALSSFTCTLLISLNVTEEWFNEGFETKYVAGDRWELRAIHAAFVDQWADPNHANWRAPLQSACKSNPNNPDRVIFVSQLDPATYLTQPQSRWETEIKKVIANIQAKYSNVKRIELMTFVRSPGNKPCPGNSTENVVPENLDKAIAALAMARPELIGVSPKLFLESCSQYTSPPHFNKAGGAYVAKQAGEHYAKEETTKP